MNHGNLSLQNGVYLYMMYPVSTKPPNCDIVTSLGSSPSYVFMHPHCTFCTCGQVLYIVMIHDMKCTVHGIECWLS